MNILYTTDDTFIPQTAASCASVLENNTGSRDICFYIMALHVSAENREALTRFVNSRSSSMRKRSVRFIDLADMESYFDFPFEITGWNPIVLARLLAGQLLPPQIDRILYLDADTIVRADLRPLYETDLMGCPLGACIEPTCDPGRKAALGLRHMPYYNAGVLLIDLKAWRAQKAGEQVITFYREMGGKLFANDQDAINGALRGKIRTLSPTWNYHNTYDLYRYRLLRKYCDYPVPSRAEIRIIRRDPAIIHFLGEDRPWRAGCTHRFRGEYRHYLSLTPWKSQPPEEGWQIYFLCWRIFNFLMKPFPLLRVSIINRLIPFMLKRRSR